MLYSVALLPIWTKPLNLISSSEHHYFWSGSSTYSPGVLINTNSKGFFSAALNLFDEDNEDGFLEVVALSHSLCFFSLLNVPLRLKNEIILHALTTALAIFE